MDMLTLIAGLTSTLLSGPFMPNPASPDGNGGGGHVGPASVSIALGLTPEVLAGSGLDAEDVSELFEAITSTELQEAIEAAALASTPESRRTANAAVSAALEEIREEVSEEMSSGCRASALSIAVGRRSGLPADIAAAVCQHGNTENATRVRRMLVQEARAARLGRTLDSEVSSALTALRADSAAVLVRQRIASNLEQIEAVFATQLAAENSPR